MLAQILAAIVVVSLGAACAEPQKPVARAKAQPAGSGVLVAEPSVRVASGTSCGEEVTKGVADRFKSAATTELAKAGFSVVSEEGKEAFTASLDLEVDYCSNAGIVSGTTAFELKKGGAIIWRGQAQGDQARGETATSTLAELFETMLFDQRVIDETKR